MNMKLQIHKVFEGIRNSDYTIEDCMHNNTLFGMMGLGQIEGHMAGRIPKEKIQEAYYQWDVEVVRPILAGDERLTIPYVAPVAKEWTHITPRKTQCPNCQHEF